MTTPTNELKFYRRHLAACGHADKGQDYSLCKCPIWGYGTINGEPFRKSLQTNDAAVAEDIRAALVNGTGTALVTLAESRVPRLVNAVGQYLALRTPGTKTGVKEGTFRDYRSVLNAFTGQCGQLPLSDITSTTMERYARDRHVSEGTWRKELRIIRSFFKWTIDEKDWLAKSPVKLKAPALRELVTMPFSEEEFDALLWAAGEIPSHFPQMHRMARALVLTLVHTGLRISDVAMLRRSALNHATGRLTLRVIKTGVPVQIKLHPAAKTALESLPIYPANPDYFFWDGCSPQHCRKAALADIIRRLGKQVNVHAHPHRFRDTFAVRLLEKGVDIRVVSKLLGHKSLRTTELHYGHHSEKQQQVLDDAVGALDFGQQRQTAGPVLVQPLQHRGRAS